MKTRIACMAAWMSITGAVGAQSVQQQSSGVTRAEALAGSVSHLDPRSRIRVLTEKGTTEGTFSGTNGGVLLLSRNAGDTAVIPFENVQGLWKQIRSTKRGMEVGATVGAIGMGGFLILVVTGLCESANGCKEDYVPAALYGGAIGAVGGGILGAGLGALVKRWVRVDR